MNNKWNSIKEYRPEERGEYLCAYYDAFGTKEEKHLAIFFFDGERFNAYAWARVTHWMNLPDAPDEN